MSLVLFSIWIPLQPVDELRTVVFDILKKRDEKQGMDIISVIICGYCTQNVLIAYTLTCLEECVVSILHNHAHLLQSHLFLFFSKSDVKFC